MRTETAIRKELGDAAIEMRSLYDRVNDVTRSVDIGKAQSELDALAKRSAGLRRELAELRRPGGGGGGFSLMTRESLLKAAREMRAIQIGEVGSAGIGAIQQVRELFREVAESDELLNMASYYYGPNASTNIPVLTAMDEPDSYAEGTAAVKDDSGTGIYVTEIQPHSYSIVLPVTAEMIQMGAVDIEAELPSIFAKAFSTKMHKAMLTSDDSADAKLMRGIFHSADLHANANSSEARVSGTTSGSITVTELAELALRVASKDASYRIIMNPSVYQGILSSSSNDSEDIKVYKEGLIRDKSIEGVPIMLDTYAPAKDLAGSSMAIAVAAPISRYAIGVAGELVIEPIRAPRDTKTYFQAIMFFSGRQVADTDVYSVVSK